MWNRCTGFLRAHKDDAWVTNSDIKDAVNSPENLKTISRKLNNAKRDRRNSRFLRR